MEYDIREQPTIELFDSICTQLYESLDTNTRTAAEKRLYYYFPSFLSAQESVLYSEFFKNSQESPLIEVYHLIKTPLDSLKHLTWFLEQTRNDYSKFYASQRIKVLTLTYASSLSTVELESLTLGLISIIVNCQDISSRSALTELAQALAIIIMVGWLSSEEIIGSIDTIIGLYEGPKAKKLKSLLILKILVQEISREQPKKFIPKQQRIVTNFKDKKLKNIFKLAVDAMNEILSETSPDLSKEILLESIELQKEVYLFDFVGLSNDGAEDDILSIQVPAGWRDVIETSKFIDIYLEGYKQSNYPINTSFLELLSYFSSIRRTFFTEELRQIFIVKMAQGVIDIISNNIGLDEVDNYHQLCRLLSRLRTVHTFTEIESKPLYTNFLDSVTSFSLNGLSLWEWSENSLTPLLTFWVKTGSSKEYASGKSESENKITTKIKDSLAKVLTAYLVSLVSAATKSFMNDSAYDGVINSEEEVLEQLNLLAAISRVDYAKSVSVLMLAINNIAAQYQNIVNSDSCKSKETELCEVQLSWLVNAAAAFIAAKKPYQSPTEDDDSDAEMVAAVIELDNLKKLKTNKAGVSQNSLFDMSLLHFYTTYKSKYLSDKPHRITRIFVKLSALLGEIDTLQCLDIIVQRVLLNLNSNEISQPVISKSLDLFYDLSLGYNTVRQILTINSVQKLLDGGNVNSLTFLSSVNTYKLRERYYSSIIRILSVSDTLGASLTSILNQWGTEIEQLKEVVNNIKFFNQNELKEKLVFLLQALRGCLTAIITKNSYNTFFSWVFPEKLQDLYTIACLCPTDPEIQVAFLKFVREFVTNKSQRIAFEISSPNGILMFQEISKIICQAGKNLRLNELVTHDVYKHKYKLAVACYDILSKILAGKYVAIGVMPIYNDKALDSAFQSVFELTKYIPLDFVVTHAKTFSSLLGALDTLFSQNNIYLVRINLGVLRNILELCSNALNSPIVSISSSSCSVIDHMFSFTLQYMTTGKLTLALDTNPGYFDDISERSPVCKLLNGQNEIQTKFLTIIYDKVLFEESQNDWSLSRALFPLAVLQKEFFYYRSSFIVQHQSETIQPQLIKSIGSILNSTDYTLTPANRDKFTQAITQYRRDVDTHNINLVLPTTQNKGQSEFEFSDSTNTMAE